MAASIHHRPLVWELPGEYVDDDEEPVVTAAREVEEETGWRPGPLEPLISFQPMVGTGDAENLIFIAFDAEYQGPAPDVNETAAVAWLPFDSMPDRIARGVIAGSASIVALPAAKDAIAARRAASATRAQ